MSSDVLSNKFILGALCSQWIACSPKRNWRSWLAAQQFHHSTKPGTVTVAGKPSVDVPPGTLNSALKQAGLKK
jgi:hypothetical protein